MGVLGIHKNNVFCWKRLADMA